MAPAAPDAVMECPRLDFSDPIGTFATPAKIRAMLVSSVRSPRAVPVAWHSMSEISRGSSSDIS